VAQKIKPDVEKLTASEVNIGAIVVAIKRLVDRLQEEEKIQNESDLKHILPIIEGARMSLTGSVIDIDFNERDLTSYQTYLMNCIPNRQTNSPLTEDIKEIRISLCLVLKNLVVS